MEFEDEEGVADVLDDVAEGEEPELELNISCHYLVDKLIINNIKLSF